MVTWSNLILHIHIFSLSVQLHSTRFELILFSVDLLALLNWKAHPDRVLDILGRLRQISGEEIVKVPADHLSDDVEDDIRIFKFSAAVFDAVGFLDYTPRK